nr:hypothetical protein [Ornithinibacillus contaminans]
MGFKDLRGKWNQLNPLSQLKRNTSFDPKVLLHGLQAIDRLIFIVEIRNGTCVYTYANEAALKVLRYDTTLYGKTFEEVLSKDSATYLTNEYIKCIMESLFIRKTVGIMMRSSKRQIRVYIKRRKRGEIRIFTWLAPQI